MAPQYSNGQNGRRHSEGFSGRVWLVVFGLIIIIAIIILLVSIFVACSNGSLTTSNKSKSTSITETVGPQTTAKDIDNSKKAKKARKKAAKKIRKELNITTDYRSGFEHGSKPAKYQKYIVLHDTESEASAQDTVTSWDNGEGVAAHFVVNKDGSIVQCVHLNKIAHHAGFGDKGNNEKYGVENENRDDKVGTQEIGSDYPDYGMNSYSIGIEMVHDSSVDDSYPEAQLEAVDKLIEYIDTYYGFDSTIIDHSDWRSSNSDTSKAFSDYLDSYKENRRHN